MAEGEELRALGPAKQRALLALLLLHRNRALSLERLTDELWPERPPASATKSIQVYVSNLRKTLGATALRTQDYGYELAVADDEVDAVRFERLLAAGRADLGSGRPQRAAQRLREALALWRGPALADLADEAFAQSEIARLEELRLEALERLFEADLALGRARELVAGLEQLVGEHPLRERFRALLMLALYRSGRQADALAVYRDARRLLADELGLEPGPELQALERAILVQDAELGAPTRIPPAGDSSRRRWLILAGATLALAAGASALAIDFTHGSSRRTLPALGPNTLAAFDPAKGRYAENVAIPIEPDRLSVHDATAWAAASSGTVVAVTSGRRTPSRVLAAGARVSGLAAGASSVWAVSRSAGTVERIDPAYGTIARRIRVDSPSSYFLDLPIRDPWSVVNAFGAAWLTDGTSKLVRVDDVSGAIQRFDLRVPLNAVATGARALWVVSGPTASVLRVNPVTGAATLRIPIVERPQFASPYPSGIAVGEGSVWVLNANTATVTKIDPSARGIVATIQLGIDRAPTGLAVGAGGVWVADRDGTLARIDPTTDSLGLIPVGRELLGVAVSDGLVWLATGSARGLARGETTAVALPGVQAAACSPVFYRGSGEPRYLIAADLSLQGLPSFISRRILGAITLELERRAFRAGPYPIGFQVCDDTSRSGPVVYPSSAKCAAIARALARTRSVIGTLGTFFSFCAQAQQPILNRAAGGPIPTVNGTNTYVGLTRRGPGTAPGEPERYFPTGRRSYVRVVAADDYQAAADALLADRLGLRNVYVLREASPYGVGFAADFSQSARRLRIRVGGPAGWNPRAGNYRALAARIARAGADGVLVAGALSDNGATLLRDLRSTLGSGVKIIATDGFTPAEDTVAVVGPAAEGLLISAADTPLEKLDLVGKRFASAFRRAAGEDPPGFAIYAAQATDILLDAIARSHGTRASVTRELFRTRVKDGILGSFAIGPTGDATLNVITITEIRDGHPVTFAVIVPRTRLVPP